MRPSIQRAARPRFENKKVFTCLRPSMMQQQLQVKKKKWGRLDIFKNLYLNNKWPIFKVVKYYTKPGQNPVLVPQSLRDSAVLVNQVGTNFFLFLNICAEDITAVNWKYWPISSGSCCSRFSPKPRWVRLVRWPMPLGNVVSWLFVNTNFWQKTKK